tara:strand:+ start:101775 stop:101954 length:180 start_codon:yes stop_codon:yes gene_type:complete
MDVLVFDTSATSIPEPLRLAFLVLGLARVGVYKEKENSLKQLTALFKSFAICRGFFCAG